MDPWTMSSILQSLASEDPELALNLIKKMPSGPERAKREISFANNLAMQGKTAEALEIVKNSLARQPGKEKEVLLSEVANLSSSPDFAARMGEVLPPGVALTVADLAGVGKRSGRTDPVRLTKLLKSAEDQSNYLVGANGNWRSAGGRHSENS
jgi:hypothetical protein